MAAGGTLAAEAFAVGRNDPCPCGGGSKFKRCCLEAVEAARLGLRRAAGPDRSMVPGLHTVLDGLALACGLKAAGLPDDGPVSAEWVGRGLRVFLDGWSETALVSRTEALEKMLREDAILRRLRFRPDVMGRTLEDVALRFGWDRDDGEDGPVGDREERRQVGEAVIRSLVSDDLTDRAARYFLQALRRRGSEDPASDAVQALLWGLVQLALPMSAADKPLWQVVFKLTYVDVVALEEVIHQSPIDWDALPSLLDERPVIDDLLSELVERRCRAALQAVRAGAVDLRLPAWSLAFTLARLARWTQEQVGSSRESRQGGASGMEAVASEWAAAVTSPERWRELIRIAWEDDGAQLIPAFDAAVDAWLRDHPDAPAELRESLEALAYHAGAGLTRADHLLFAGVLIRALLALAKDGRVDPRDGGEPLDLFALWLNPAAVERYVAALEGAGQPDAAAHVRAAAASLAEAAAETAPAAESPVGTRHP